MKKILIGGAWPYANGSLHIGHIAALLPGDVLARYWRLKGADVYYVSGSDCHGTPITVRARQEGKSPEAISSHYHQEFSELFRKLGFSYDRYTCTSSEHHRAFVTRFHERLYQSPYVQERTVHQAWCPVCAKAVTDRMITGLCPRCGEPTRGDQCDACGEVLEADSVVDARCAECGSSLGFQETKQLFLLVSQLEKELSAMLNAHPGWRKNAVAFTRRYLAEGLRDRAITRDLDWGIPVPKEGYEEKRIYIWAENVLGYLSACAEVCEERGTDWQAVFGAETFHYYVHGKDNIPFHTIILPSLLLAHGGGLRLPDEIISSEYMTLEGSKISTSRGHAVWAKELAECYPPDTIRYFFLINGPEKRDTDFSWREFAERNNAELVGTWGNFVNRTLAFAAKYLGNRIPHGTVETELASRTAAVFEQAGAAIENGRFKDALYAIFDLIRFGNRYYDAHQPWKTRTENPAVCEQTLYNCAWLIANLSVLMSPFLPFPSEKAMKWLNISPVWQLQAPPGGRELPPLSLLFSRFEIPMKPE